MNQNRTPLVIIGSVIVLAIVGIVVFSISQNSGKSAMDDMNHSQDGNSQNANTADAVTIEKYAFSPAAIKVKVGTKVTWTNKDSVEHTVTSDDGTPAKIDSGLFGKGEDFSFTFDKAGTYTYYCQPHPYMKGTVIVTE